MAFRTGGLARLARKNALFRTDTQAARPRLGEYASDRRHREPKSASCSADLDRSPTGHQINHGHDQSDHQQQMDKTSGNMETPSQQPQNQQNGKDSPKHQSHLTPAITGYPELRSCLRRRSCINIGAGPWRRRRDPTMFETTSPIGPTGSAHSVSVCGIECSFQCPGGAPLQACHLSPAITHLRLPAAPSQLAGRFPRQDWAHFLIAVSLRFVEVRSFPGFSPYEFDSGAVSFSPSAMNLVRRLVRNEVVAGRLLILFQIWNKRSGGQFGG